MNLFSSPVKHVKMRRLILLILILVSSTSYSQLLPKSNVKPLIIKSTLLFVSGACDGTSEVLRINYNQFKKVHTKANDQFWNPNISYTNKWKNGDYKQGEKFFLSSTALVWTTDGYHELRMNRDVIMITAICIPIGDNKNWKNYLIEAAAYYFSYTLGFNVMYNLIYKMP